MDRQQSVAVNGADTMRGASGGSVGKRFRLAIVLVCLLAGAALAEDAILAVIKSGSNESNT
jgi:hypothetical protein